MFCTNEACEKYAKVMTFATVKEWDEESQSFKAIIPCPFCKELMTEMVNRDFTSINMINKGANKVSGDHKTIY